MDPRLLAAFAGEQIDHDVARQIALVHQDEAPLYAALLAANSVAETATRTFTWFTDALPGRTTTINNGGAAYTSGTTALVVANSAIFKPNEVVLAEATGEVMLVTAVNYGTHTLTVVRGVGSVVAAHADSVANTAVLRNIGHAGGEFAGAPAASHGVPTKHQNALQAFRKAVAISGWAKREGLKTEDERARLRNAKMVEQMHDIEQALMHGAYDDNVAGAGGARVTTTGGVFQAVTANVTNVGGNLTEALWYQFCEEKAFAYGPNRKVMFAGATLHRYLHLLYKDRIRQTMGEVAVGLRVTELVTPAGTVELMLNRALKGPYLNQAMIIDPDQVRLRYGGGDDKITQGGMLHLRPNLEDVDVDGSRDEWFAEYGLMYGSPLHHAILRGVTGVA